MSTDVLRTLTAKLLKLNLPVSQFCWQGGEPTLMGPDFYQTAVDLQMELGTAGQSVSNAIQTNGLNIDEQWAKFFAKYKFLIGISLDGPADIHDRHRGEGTGERVIRATKILTDNAVEFNILTVVNRTNEDRGRHVYSYLREQGFDYLQFIPAVETDEHGQPLPFAVTAEGYGRFMCDVFDAWIDEGGEGKVHVRTFEAIICKLAGAPPASCIMGTRCDHYILIEHNGDVFPCDFFVRPEMKLGNVLEMEFAELLATERAKAFAVTKSKYPPKCKQCRYLSLCHGGCLKDRERAAGSFNGQTHETFLCPSYKLFFDHTFNWFKRTADHLSRKPPITVQPTRPPGRNSPCPCGSGNKFKQCCGKGTGRTG